MTSAAVSRAAAAVGLAVVAVACVYVLHWPDPFQFGLLSVVVYVAPLVVAVLAIRRMSKSNTASGVRRVLLEALAMLAVLLVLAVPLGFLQRTLAATVWFTGSGVPSRASTQVITIPGMTQEAYLWAARQRQLTAYFDAPIGPGEFWSAIERVRNGASNPCATADYPDGDDSLTEKASCTRAAQGLWVLRISDGSGIGFVRRTDGVTVTLTGLRDDRTRLQHAILAAHPASDTELWTRIDPIPPARPSFSSDSVGPGRDRAVIRPNGPSVGLPDHPVRRLARPSSDPPDRAGAVARTRVVRATAIET